MITLPIYKSNQSSFTPFQKYERYMRQQADFNNMPQKTSQELFSDFTNLEADGQTWPLINRNDLEYQGKIYIGEPNPQVFRVAMDTGSTWAAVKMVGCLNCGHDDTLYDPKNSTTHHTDSLSCSQAYGIGNLSGIVYQDTVCFDSLFSNETAKEDSCTNGFSFIGMLSQSSFDSVDGIIGFSPNDPSFVPC